MRSHFLDFSMHLLLLQTKSSRPHDSADKQKKQINYVYINSSTDVSGIIKSYWPSGKFLDFRPEDREFESDRALMNFILRNSIRNYHVITKDNIVRKPAA